MSSRGSEYRELDKFIGQWSTEGEIFATTTSPAILIHGKDTYEWLPGEFFLLHKVDVFVGEDKNETLEIIGFDQKKNIYSLQHYDNNGNSGFMTATLVNDLWTFTGESLRFEGGFNLDNSTFSGIWEQTSDGTNWLPFMNIKLKKVSGNLLDIKS